MSKGVGVVAKLRARDSPKLEEPVCVSPPPFIDFPLFHMNPFIILKAHLPFYTFKNDPSGY